MEKFLAFHVYRLPYMRHSDTITVHISSDVSVETLQTEGFSVAWLLSTCLYGVRSQRTFTRYAIPRCYLIVVSGM